MNMLKHIETISVYELKVIETCVRITLNHLKESTDPQLQDMAKTLEAIHKKLLGMI